jgi:uncharacterized integral membrane protein
MDNNNNSSKRWKNRRRMAWIAMICGCLYPLLILVVDNVDLTEIAWPFYTFLGAIVGAYVGFSTVDDKWQRKEDYSKFS